MKTSLTPADITGIRRSIAESHDLQNDHLATLLIPTIEAVEISVSHQLEDLARDTAMGFAEVHGKIEYLRIEMHEIKQMLNNLFH